jgi:hypothetical protein
MESASEGEGDDVPTPSVDQKRVSDDGNMMRTDSVTSVQFMKYADLKAHNFK